MGAGRDLLRQVAMQELEPRRLLAYAGPDGFGYEANLFGYENLDLVPGDAGVTSFLDDNDDDPFLLSLSGHTFNFYGTSYSQLYVTPNGLITLGAAPPGDAYNNTDLTDAPLQATIAPLWDDYRTDIVTSASGPFNDVLLSKIDTAGSRLIIEWNCVRSWSAPDGAFITFQAIFQLDTGSTPGAITFNYSDLGFGNLFDDGYGASIGIKAAGVQGANTLLVKPDQFTYPEITDQTAIRIAMAQPSGTGSISGFVYHDKDLSQTFNGSDSALSGISVYLDLDNDGTFDSGEPTQLTSSGNYTFSGLADGTYHVRISGNDYWLGTAPAPNVSGGGASTDVNVALVARTYSGTSSNDTFLVRPRAASSNYEVVFNGSTSFVIPSTIPSVLVIGLDGDDTATLEALPFHADFYGGTTPSDHDTLSITGGSHNFTGNLGAFSAHLNLSVAAGAAVTFNGTQRLANVNIAGNVTLALNGNSVFQADTISFTGSGRLDLKDNDLVVENMPFTTVRAMVQAGRTSSVGLSSTAGNGTQILALFDNALVHMTQWLGATLGANAIVGKYTYFGDVNMDGRVTGDDYTVIDSNLNTTPMPGRAWMRGDANIDGSVTGDDYTTVDSNLGLGVGSPLSPADLTLARPLQDLLDA